MEKTYKRLSKARPVCQMPKTSDSHNRRLGQNNCSFDGGFGFGGLGRLGFILLYDNERWMKTWSLRWLITNLPWFIIGQATVFLTVVILICMLTPWLALWWCTSKRFLLFFFFFKGAGSIRSWILMQHTHVSAWCFVNVPEVVGLVRSGHGSSTPVCVL